jgi:tyrosyl-tRNA synthetase
MSQVEFEQRFQAVDKKKIDQLGEIVNLIFDAGLRGTKADARRLVNQGGLKVNGKQFTELRQITSDDLLFDKYVVLKAGKKKFAILELN